MNVLRNAPIHVSLLIAVIAATAVFYWLKPEWAIFPAIGLVPLAVSLARKLGLEPIDDPAALKKPKVH